MNPRLKKILIGLVVILALAVILTPGYLRRALIYQTPDIDDYRIFHNRTIVAGEPQPWQEDSLYNFFELPEHHLDSFFELEPVAFLIARNGHILFEEYYDGYGQSSLSGSFSMAKSIVALLVGIAYDEGYIQSLNQPVRDFLPEFEIASDGEVTIRHLLTMSAGLDWDEQYATAFSLTTKAYYGSDLEALLKPLGRKYPPGEIFDYTSGTTQLLAFVLEEATGQNISDYAAQKLWQPMGAEHDALWSLDREGGMEKAYCCFNSNARDFARLGQLVLDTGAWKGQQLISANFLTQAVSPATYLKDQYGKVVDYYGYQFWIAYHRGYEVPYFRGILGQYIFIIPQWDAVVVRLGHKRSDYRIEGVPSDVYLYLDMDIDYLEKTSAL